MSEIINNDRWFAWHPVITDDYRFVWLRFVKRTKYKILVTDKETLEFHFRTVWGYEL